MPRWYRSDIAQAILKRALELDQESSDTISTSDIYDIGVELGISRSAVDRALMEMATSEVTVAARHHETSPKWRALPIPLVALLAGISLASSLRFLQELGAGGIVALSAIVAALSGSVVLAALYKGVAKHERFQFANAVFWTGFMLPLVVLGGTGFDDTLASISPYAAMSGIAGSIVIGSRQIIASLMRAEANASETFTTRALRAILATLWHR